MLGRHRFRDLVEIKSYVTGGVNIERDCGKGVSKIGEVIGGITKTII